MKSAFEMLQERGFIQQLSHEEEIKEMFGDEDYELPPIWLRAENPAYEHIIPKDSQSISIQGVVTFNLKQFYRRSTSK